MDHRPDTSIRLILVNSRAVGILLLRANDCLSDLRYLCSSNGLSWDSLIDMPICVQPQRIRKVYFLCPFVVQVDVHHRRGNHLGVVAWLGLQILALLLERKVKRVWLLILVFLFRVDSLVFRLESWLLV